MTVYPSHDRYSKEAGRENQAIYHDFRLKKEHLWSPCFLQNISAPQGIKYILNPYSEGIDFRRQNLTT